MTLVPITGPAEEPVTLEEAREHLRLDARDQDAMVTALITAARTVLEGETRRAFVTQEWRLLLDDWPGATVQLPLAPISAVSAVRLADADGEACTLDEAHYDLALAGDPPRVVARAPWPAPQQRVYGIAIDFLAGYGAASDVPQPLKQAILMLVAHWFETREPVGFGAGSAEIPMTVAALIAPYRRVRL